MAYYFTLALIASVGLDFGLSFPQHFIRSSSNSAKGGIASNGEGCADLGKWVSKLLLL